MDTDAKEGGVLPEQKSEAKIEFDSVTTKMLTISDLKEMKKMNLLRRWMHLRVMVMMIKVINYNLYLSC